MGTSKAQQKQQLRNERRPKVRSAKRSLIFPALGQTGNRRSASLPAAMLANASQVVKLQWFRAKWGIG
jgi:hypothetical protein